MSVTKSQPRYSLLVWKWLLGKTLLTLHRKKKKIFSAPENDLFVKETVSGCVGIVFPCGCVSAAQGIIWLA